MSDQVNRMSLAAPPGNWEVHDYEDVGGWTSETRVLPRTPELQGLEQRLRLLSSAIGALDFIPGSVGDEDGEEEQDPQEEEESDEPTTKKPKAGSSKKGKRTVGPITFYNKPDVEINPVKVSFVKKIFVTLSNVSSIVYYVC